MNRILSRKDRLLLIGDRLANRGYIRRSEDMYNMVINDYPTDHEGYQRLWNSWVGYRSLRVTEKELDDFMGKYNVYFLSKGT
jgi:hypothetical protein